ncbi:Brain-specific angiogenesis inhibitor 1-associated protein 2, partial [Dufourea novaeangliae]
QNILEKFNPGARQLINAGKAYLKALHGAAAASRVYVDALSRLARDAQLGTWGGSKDVGFALMRIVEVYKEIQEQEMNILKAFYVDLLVPLETNLEKDTKVVQSEQKKFLQQHKTRSDTYSKAAATMKKQRKKSRGASKTGLAMDKELKNMQILEEEKSKLDAFCEQSLKNAMTQERRRYGFVLERQCSLAKHYASFHEVALAALHPSVDKWREVAATREYLPQSVEDMFASRLRQVSFWPESEENGGSELTMSSQLRKTRSMDSSCLELRPGPPSGNVSSTTYQGPSSHLPTALSRARSEANLHASTLSLDPEVPETPPRPRSMAPPASRNSGSVGGGGSGTGVSSGGWGDAPLARALFAYLSSGENQLSFLENDLIALMGDRQKGWQFGENLRTHSSGWFPLAYTEIIIDDILGSPSHGTNNGRASEPQVVPPCKPPPSRPPVTPSSMDEVSSGFHGVANNVGNSNNNNSSSGTPTNVSNSNSSHNLATPTARQSKPIRPSGTLPTVLAGGRRLQPPAPPVPPPQVVTSLHSSNDSGFSNEPPAQPDIDYSDDEAMSPTVRIQRSNLTLQQEFQESVEVSIFSLKFTENSACVIAVDGNKIRRGGGSFTSPGSCGASSHIPHPPHITKSATTKLDSRITNPTQILGSWFSLHSLHSSTLFNLLLLFLLFFFLLFLLLSFSLFLAFSFTYPEPERKRRQRRRKPRADRIAEAAKQQKDEKSAGKDWENDSWKTIPRDEKSWQLYRTAMDLWAESNANQSNENGEVRYTSGRHYDTQDRKNGRDYSDRDTIENGPSRKSGKKRNNEQVEQERRAAKRTKEQEETEEDEIEIEEEEEDRYSARIDYQKYDGKKYYQADGQERNSRRGYRPVEQEESKYENEKTSSASSSVTDDESTITIPETGRKVEHIAQKLEQTAQKYAREHSPPKFIERRNEYRSLERREEKQPPPPYERYNEGERSRGPQRFERERERYFEKSPPMSQKTSTYERERTFEKNPERNRNIERASSRRFERPRPPSEEAPERPTEPRNMYRERRYSDKEEAIYGETRFVREVTVDKERGYESNFETKLERTKVIERHGYQNSLGQENHEKFQRNGPPSLEKNDTNNNTLKDDNRKPLLPRQTTAVGHLIQTGRAFEVDSKSPKLVKRTKSFWRFRRDSDVLEGMALWQHRSLVDIPKMVKKEVKDGTGSSEETKKQSPEGSPTSRQSLETRNSDVTITNEPRSDELKPAERSHVPDKSDYFEDFPTPAERPKAVERSEYRMPQEERSYFMGNVSRKAIIEKERKRSLEAKRNMIVAELKENNEAKRNERRKKYTDDEDGMTQNFSETEASDEESTYSCIVVKDQTVAEKTLLPRTKLRRDSDRERDKNTCGPWYDLWGVDASVNKKKKKQQ